MLSTSRILRSQLAITFLATLFSPFAFASMSIKAPDIAENGNVVPFELNISPSLGKGETLTVYSGDNKAYVVTTNGSSNIATFSSRVRLEESGEIKAVRSGKQNDTISKNIMVSKGASWFSSGPSSPEDVSYKIRASSDGFKILINGKVSKSRYIRDVDFTTSNGGIHIKLTPYATDNPFFGFTGNFSGEPKVSVALNDGPEPRDNVTTALFSDHPAKRTKTASALQCSYADLGKFIKQQESPVPNDCNNLKEGSDELKNCVTRVATEIGGGDGRSGLKIIQKRLAYKSWAQTINLSFLLFNQKDKQSCQNAVDEFNRKVDTDYYNEKGRWRIGIRNDKLYLINP